MKKLLLLLVLLSAGHTYATHVIGGEIIYKHLGGSSYVLTCKLYRDCSPGTFDFPTSVNMAIREGDGSVPAFGGTINLPIQGRDTLSPPIDTCAFDPGICVEEAIFSKVVSLPPGTQGYHTWFTICCRNGSILNIFDPLSARETFYAFIPDNNTWLTNSSPSFSNFPPVFVCQGVDLDLDFSATDPDGDSLDYYFYTPFDGVNGTAITFDADPIPDNWNSSSVTFLAGFCPSDPLDVAAGCLPGITISSGGIINGIPPATGQYVLGVMVDEYRDGILIGRKSRDFQFNVLNCPPPQDAAIDVVDGCNGSIIDFTNASGAGANGFWWDFGTGDPADTSVVEDPTFDYTAYGLGPFTVTLIAQKGTLCADTTYATVIISDVVADFTGPDTLCIDELGDFFDASVPEVNGTVNYWEWDFGDASTSALQNPTHAWSAGGDYTIQLVVGTDVGCFDTITKDIHIKAPLSAGIAPMAGCIGLDVTFTNISDPGAGPYWWDFGTGFPADTSILTNPSFTYGTYGSYDVMLVASHGTGCADTAVFTLLVSNVVADFVQPDTTCVNVLIDFIDASTNVNGTITSWQWDFGDASTSTAEDPSHGYTSAGDYTVTLIVQTDIGCTDTISKVVTIMDAPYAAIGPIDVCSGLTVDFINNSAAGASGFWWDFGTGDPADTSVVYEPTFTFPSYGTYTVTLVTQKGSDCESTTDYTFNLSNIIADFIMADTACENSTVSFTDASSSVAGTTITTWEWDFGDFATSALTDPNHTYTPDGDYDVQLVVTNDVGCTDTLVKTINIQIAPVANAGIDTAVCVSDPSYDLSGLITNAGGGVWTGNGGVFAPSTTDLNATYFPSLAELTAGGTFLILESTGNGSCPADKDTIYIDYLDNPNVDAGGDIDVCEDSLYIILNATLDFTANVLWTTSGDGSFDDDQILGPTYTFGPTDLPSGSVTFYIETSNFSGCPEDADTITLFFNPFPTITTIDDTTICAGFPLTLNSGSSTGSALWGTTGDGIFTPNPGATTSYDHGTADETAGGVTLFFESADNGGCPALYDTIDVTIIPSPEPGFTFEEVCFGDTTYFTNTSTAVEPITAYNWTFEVGETSTDEDPGYLFSGPGTHFVELIVETANGCQDTIIQPVKAYYIPDVDFDVPAPCLNGETQFVDLTTVGDTTIASWSWDFGEPPATDTAQNPTYNFNTSGPHDITLTVTSEFGCTATVVNTINVLPGPTADFESNPNPSAPAVDVQFTDLSTPGDSPIVTWEWIYGDGDTTKFDTQHPIHAFADEGEWPVDLVVTDADGCRDTVQRIQVVYHGPQVPNAFSPNGDGNNDFLMILGGNYETIDFKIYNNWGHIIFETQDPNSPGWDGTFNGKDQPIGVYVFVANVTTYDGEVHELSGDVSLVR